MTTTGTLADYADHRLEPGFAYPHTTVVVDQQEQQRLHGWCGIEPEVFGLIADPALVGRLPMVMISNTIAAQRPTWGQVHTVQRIKQHRPIGLGEVLALHGAIESFEAHPRGEILQSRWRYVDADGDMPFEVIADGLLIDPTPRPNSAKQPATIQDDDSEYVLQLTKRCTPAATVGYCAGTNNPIHTDIEVAQKFGFRAPILAGTHSMSFLLEPLYRRYSPHAMSLTIRFMRPVFWDDVITVRASTRDRCFHHIQALNGARKCVADCCIDAFSE